MSLTQSDSPVRSNEAVGYNRPAVPDSEDRRNRGAAGEQSAKLAAGRSGPTVLRQMPRLTAALLLLVLVTGATAQTFTYAYDELGRLIAVVDPSGNAGVYNYDAVGNLLSISNTTASKVSIFTFTPNNGAAGLTVTIYGDGFSTTPSQNTVTFYNGLNVTPSQATVAKLTVAVPQGVSTGKITVTSPNGTATSSENFTVN